MKLEGTVKKAFNSAIKNADKLGMLYAVIQDPIGDGRGLGELPHFVIDRLSKWKIPTNLEFYIHELKTNPFYNGPLRTALMAYLAGYGLDFIGQTKYGKPLKEAAVGMVKGTAIAAALWLPAINPHGSSSTTENFSNAPTISNYEY